MRKFLRRWKTRILVFAAVIGPGIITANVDNDAGGIFTYSAAGAQFGQALLATVKLPDRKMFVRQDYLYMVIGLVGTTIAPWMQFYLQSSVVEKGITRRDYKLSRLDVIAGCFFTELVAWFIIVTCAATIYLHGSRNISDAADAAQALKPLAKEFAYILFALRLFNTSLFATSILPLSTV